MNGQHTGWRAATLLRHRAAPRPPAHTMDLDDPRGRRDGALPPLRPLLSVGGGSLGGRPRHAHPDDRPEPQGTGGRKSGRTLGRGSHPKLRGRLDLRRPAGPGGRRATCAATSPRRGTTSAPPQRGRPARRAPAWSRRPSWTKRRAPRRGAARFCSPRGCRKTSARVSRAPSLRSPRHRGARMLPFVHRGAATVPAEAGEGRPVAEEDRPVDHRDRPGLAHRGDRAADGLDPQAEVGGHVGPRRQRQRTRPRVPLGAGRHEGGGPLHRPPPRQQQHALARPPGLPPQRRAHGGPPTRAPPPPPGSPPRGSGRRGRARSPPRRRGGRPRRARGGRPARRSPGRCARRPAGCGAA